MPHFSFQEGRAWYRSLVEQRWKQLGPSLADLAGPHYLRARAALASLAALADDRTALPEPVHEMLKTVR